LAPATLDQLKVGVGEMPVALFTGTESVGAGSSSAALVAAMTRWSELSPVNIGSLKTTDWLLADSLPNTSGLCGNWA
jgi:hypothetical protein